MKYFISFVAIAFLGYLLVDWALDNPTEARELRSDVDQTTGAAIDKAARAAEQLGK